MTTEDIEFAYVCHRCICDPFLAEIVRAKGTCVLCSYCDRVSEALTLDDLAERIHEVLQAHFEITPSIRWVTSASWLKTGFGNDLATLSET